MPDPSTQIFVCEDQSGLPDIVRQTLEFSSGVWVWLFEGDLGAGKTTTIKELCRQLKCIDEPSSPTFNIINEYLTEDARPVYHFDFYRIKDETEAYDIGVEEYFDSSYYCFVEWPEKIPSLWPDQYMRVIITYDESERRTFEVRKYE